MKKKIFGLKYLEKGKKVISGGDVGPYSQAVIKDGKSLRGGILIDGSKLTVPMKLHNTPL